LGRGIEFSKVFPVLDIHLMPIIHTCASESPVINGKTKRFNQMQPTLSRQAEPGDISGIRRNFRFDQHNVKHVLAKISVLENKKSASTFEALFPSGGKM
jgi:hypothetical protein